MHYMKTFKGYAYFQDKDGIWKVIVNNSHIVVALDDSKINTNRQIIESKNNELTCKYFIDWLTK